MCFDLNTKKNGEIQTERQYCIVTETRGITIKRTFFATLILCGENQLTISVYISDFKHFL